jgi:hypothetical protein
VAWKAAAGLGIKIELELNATLARMTWGSPTVEEWLSRST